MEKMKLGIMGPLGRMGKSIISEARNFNKISISAFCEQKGHPKVGSKIDGIEVLDSTQQFISSCDVIIDFSQPKATINLLKDLQKQSSTALITGTTGFSKNEEKKFYQLAQGLKVLRASNMSMGICLLTRISNIVSSKIGKSVDIEIIESHHKLKKDSPSGTAISLGEAVKKGRKNYEKNIFVYRGLNFNQERKKGEIGFSSIRGGDVVGEHSVIFFMNGERLELTHKATEREIFSRGSLNAALWIKNQKPGLYNMQDMIEF